MIRLGAAIGGLLLVIVLTRLAHAYIGRYMDDPDARYRARKASTTLAWVLFLITLALTAVLFWSQSRWVYYAGDKRR